MFRCCFSPCSASVRESPQGEAIVYEASCARSSSKTSVSRRVEVVGHRPSQALGANCHPDSSIASFSTVHHLQAQLAAEIESKALLCKQLEDACKQAEQAAESIEAANKMKEMVESLVIELTIQVQKYEESAKSASEEARRQQRTNQDLQQKLRGLKIQLNIMSTSYQAAQEEHQGLVQKCLDRDMQIKEVQLKNTLQMLRITELESMVKRQKQVIRGIFVNSTPQSPSSETSTPTASSISSIQSAPHTPPLEVSASKHSSYTQHRLCQTNFEIPSRDVVKDQLSTNQADGSMQMDCSSESVNRHQSDQGLAEDSVDASTCQLPFSGRVMLDWPGTYSNQGCSSLLAAHCSLPAAASSDP